ncbi:MAG: periplasmic heavy metal sensor [Bacteroidota bacterium]|nr:periplasmic heavy metal sensor [Bacteroidota bacterium]
MNAIVKSRLLTGLILLLLIANMLTLGLYWWKRTLPAPPPPMKNERVADFLIHELQLDSPQRLAYQQLVKAHRKDVQGIREKTRIAKEAFFELLKKENVSEAEIRNAAANASSAQQEIDLLTFHHFQKVRALCNESQKEKFDDIIQDVLRMNAPQQGPPPPHDEPHDNDLQEREHLPPPGNDRDMIPHP